MAARGSTRSAREVPIEFVRSLVALGALSEDLAIAVTSICRTVVPSEGRGRAVVRWPVRQQPRPAGRGCLPWHPPLGPRTSNGTHAPANGLSRTTGSPQVNQRPPASSRYTGGDGPHPPREGCGPPWEPWFPGTILRFDLPILRFVFANTEFAGSVAGLVGDPVVDAEPIADALAAKRPPCLGSQGRWRYADRGFNHHRPAGG